MKKILITGSNSYIGTSFEKYLIENYFCDYSIDTIDVRNDEWKNRDFEKFDVVFHVAGIVHQKETEENACLYYEVNCKLTYEIAKKAKDSGIKQFIFLSSMSVYGMDTGIITSKTIPHPKSNYGKSKLQAEIEIRNLESDNFKICILRPPMVYGEGCKGNYQNMVKLIKKIPIFPRINNKKSVVYILTLIKYVKNLIDLDKSGLFFPQENKYISTMELAKNIAINENKRIYFSYILGVLITIHKPFFKTLRKAFGNLIYVNI